MIKSYSFVHVFRDGAWNNKNILASVRLAAKLLKIQIATAKRIDIFAIYSISTRFYMHVVRFYLQEQYKFIYLALNDALWSGVTAIPSQMFISELQTLKEPNQEDGQSKLQTQFEVTSVPKTFWCFAFGCNWQIIRNFLRTRMYELTYLNYFILEVWTSTYLQLTCM